MAAPLAPALAALEAELRRAAAAIEPTLDAVRLQVERGDDGTAHVEHVAGEYHLVATERGLELSRASTPDPGEILYWLLRDLAFGRAREFEFRHRVRGQSFRRLLFAQQVEYLRRVSPAYAERREREIAAILREHPYDDAREG